MCVSLCIIHLIYHVSQQINNIASSLYPHTHTHTMLGQDPKDPTHFTHPTGLNTPSAPSGVVLHAFYTTPHTPHTPHFARGTPAAINTAADIL